MKFSDSGLCLTGLSRIQCQPKCLGAELQRIYCGFGGYSSTTDDHRLLKRHSQKGSDKARQTNDYTALISFVSLENWVSPSITALCVEMRSVYLSLQVVVFLSTYVLHTNELNQLWWSHPNHEGRIQVWLRRNRREYYPQIKHEKIKQYKMTPNRGCRFDRACYPPTNLKPAPGGPQQVASHHARILVWPKPICWSRVELRKSGG